MNQEVMLRLPHGSRWLLATVLFALASTSLPSALADSAPPTIRIAEPVDGAVVNGPEVNVRVEVSNFTLQLSASGKKPNTGHIHFWIDDYAAGPMYATPEISIELPVPPGHHKIRAELVQDDHKSLAEGHRGETVLAIPSGDDAFEHRPSMSTVSIDVR